MAKSDEGIQIAAHIAHRRNSVSKKQGKNEFAAARRFARAGEMDVHVDEAGNQKFSGGVESSCAARN